MSRVVLTSEELKKVIEITEMTKRQMEELTGDKIIVREKLKGYGVVGQKKYTIINGRLYRKRY